MKKDKMTLALIYIFNSFFLTFMHKASITIEHDDQDVIKAKAKATFNMMITSD